MKSLVTARNTYVLAHVPTDVVRSDAICDGAIVVDVLMTRGESPRYAFLLWERCIDSTSLGDDVVYHRYDVIYTSQLSQPFADPLAAWLAASNYVIRNPPRG